MAQVGLDDVHAAGLQQALEVILGKQTLAGGNGHIAGSGDLLEHLHVLAQDGLLDEHGVELFQLLGQDLCHGLVHTAVEVDGDAEILAAAFPDGGHAFQNGVHLVVGVDHLQLFGGVHLDGGKAGILALQSSSAHVVGAVAADPAVHAHVVAAGTAHELVDRGVEELALDIPQGLINAGNGAHQHAAAAVEPGAVQHSGKVLNAHGVLADEVGLHLLDTGQNGGAVAFQHGFAPAGQALVGHDLNKAPAGTDGIGVDFNDLHGKSSFLLYCRRFQWVQVQRWIWSTMPRT